MHKLVTAILGLWIGFAAVGCGGNTGPAGAPGAQGAQGTQGAAGQAGAAANVNDLVYGKAVDNILITGTVDWSNPAGFAASTNHQPLDFSFGNLTLATGATLIVPTGVTIRCRGQLIVSPTATLQVVPSVDDAFSGSEGTISLAGTQAHTALTPNLAFRTPGLLSAFPSLLPPLRAGGSGAPVATPFRRAGRGGGAIAFRALGGIINAGQIQAVGEPGETAAGFTTAGGGGGLVILMWGAGSTFNNPGTINCNGGNGGVAGANSSGSGGGGGGLVRLAGPGATGVGGFINVSGGQGQTHSGIVTNGTPLSAGGSSQGDGGGVLPTGDGVSGTAGLVVRSDVPDPIALLTLAKNEQ